jgi:hypothetical protein
MFGVVNGWCDRLAGLVTLHNRSNRFLRHLLMVRPAGAGVVRRGPIEARFWFVL